MERNSAGRLPRVDRKHILNAYKAGPEAVVSLIEYLQEQFQTTLDEMNSALAHLTEENKKLVARIQVLEEKINKDSHNSNSLLPATDWPGGSAGSDNPAARNRADK